MKRFPLICLLVCTATVLLTSCLGENKVDNTWRKANEAFYEQQKQRKNSDGSNYFKAVTAAWDSSAQVLVHWHNDTNLTKNNLKPLYTSTVDVKYKLNLYNGAPLDSSYKRTTPADSIFRTKLTSGSVIAGWAVALTNMHVGDSCEVVIPQSMGYGPTTFGGVKGFSTLVFNIKRVDIAAYEKKKPTLN